MATSTSSSVWAKQTTSVTQIIAFIPRSAKFPFHRITSRSNHHQFWPVQPTLHARANMTFQQYAEKLIAKLCKAADAHNEGTLNGVFIKEVDQTTRHSMRNYRAVNLHADLAIITFQAKSHLGIKRRPRQQLILNRLPSAFGKQNYQNPLAIKWVRTMLTQKLKFSMTQLQTSIRVTTGDKSPIFKSAVLNFKPWLELCVIDFIRCMKVLQYVLRPRSLCIETPTFGAPALCTLVDHSLGKSTKVNS